MDAHTNPWHGRRVLVTGCTGLLGSAVTRELLARGATVVGLVRDRGPAFAGDFRPSFGRAEDAARLHAAMAVHEASAVFHLADTDRRTPDRGTAAVLRAAALYHPRVPVVVARPAAHLRIARDEEVPVALGVARFGELFGGGDRKAPVAGTTPRDYVFVRDAARACLLVAEAVGAAGRSLDVTFRTGWCYTPRDMTAKVAAVSAGGSVDADDAPENPLGWRPQLTLAEALRETVAASGERPAVRRAA